MMYRILIDNVNGEQCKQLVTDRWIVNDYEGITQEIAEEGILSDAFIGVADGNYVMTIMNHYSENVVSVSFVHVVEEVEPDRIMVGKLDVLVSNFKSMDCPRSVTVDVCGFRAVIHILNLDDFFKFARDYGNVFTMDIGNRPMECRFIPGEKKRSVNVVRRFFTETQSDFIF